MSCDSPVSKAPRFPVPTSQTAHALLGRHALVSSRSVEGSRGSAEAATRLCMDGLSGGFSPRRGSSAKRANHTTRISRHLTGVHLRAANLHRATGPVWGSVRGDRVCRVLWPHFRWRFMTACVPAQSEQGDLAACRTVPMTEQAARERAGKACGFELERHAGQRLTARPEAGLPPLPVSNRPCAQSTRAAFVACNTSNPLGPSAHAHASAPRLRMAHCFAAQPCSQATTVRAFLLPAPCARRSPVADTFAPGSCRFAGVTRRYVARDSFSLPNRKKTLQMRTERESDSSYTPDESSRHGLGLLKDDARRFSEVVRNGPKSRLRAFPRYDPAAIATYYDKYPLLSLKRASAIALPFAVWYLRTRTLDKWSQGSPDRQQRRAAELRKIIASAGATVLKLGQAASSRPDVIGATYLAELQKLTDQVGAFDSEEALRIVQEDLSLASVEDAFLRFERTPVASASLGQVHRATLRSGEEVAVKVQRPNLALEASLDVYLLRKLAAFLKERFKLRSDVVSIVDEFAMRLWEEIDYRKEASNAERFAKYYGTGLGVYVPQIFREYTSRKVLTMEWIDGDKPPWYPAEDAQRLIAIGVRCSLTQLLSKGFLHGDPHVGNLLRRRRPGQRGSEGGELVWLDFGMCVEVERQARIDLIRAITNLINRNYSEVARDFVRLGFLPDGTDTGPLEPMIERAFRDAQSGDEALSGLSFGRLADNLAELAYSSPIRIPASFTILIRSLTILEGIALQANPSFKIVDAAYPYVVQRLLEDDSPELQNALEETLILPNGRVKWSRLESILKASDVDPERAVSSSTSAAPSIGRFGSKQATEDGALSPQGMQRIKDFVLGQRGKFIRDALTLEAADILDSAQLKVASDISSNSRGILPAPPDAPNPEQLRRGRALLQLLQGRSSAINDPRISRELYRAAWVAVGEVTERNARRAVRTLGNALLDTILGPKRST